MFGCLEVLLFAFGELSAIVLEEGGSGVELQRLVRRAEGSTPGEEGSELIS